MERYEEIERSITKTYRKELWARFIKAINDYKLLEEGDHICVCISGGKDSMLLAKLFEELHKHSDFPFDVTYLVMNPGYNPINLEVIKKNLEILNIKATLVETNIFDIAYTQDKSPCFLCAKMRRGALYNFAKKLGCNKIALGHHYDDVIETTLMNMLNSGSFQTMLPKLKSTNYEGMELIRPMYLIREEDILRWCRHNDLKFIQCACRISEQCANSKDGESGSQRYETKKLIKRLKEEYNAQVDQNIFASMSNVNLDQLVGYKKGGKPFSYLDKYDER